MLSDVHKNVELLSNVTSRKNQPAPDKMQPISPRKLAANSTTLQLALHSEGKFFEPGEVERPLNSAEAIAMGKRTLIVDLKVRVGRRDRRDQETIAVAQRPTVFEQKRGGSKA